ncbi:hypothetical protein FZEAL_4361 [Fusarium zealandicum]|uniref:Helicase n=1 Tax=Fusarium zealandicum TaxID=1053134 RepID=A0A8H4UMH1_9HYPO|nr:hypothetical protein FZEAL_4361 [Fusarium zealandicum]
MGSSNEPSAETLLKWYSDQHPLTVDIVGDFAGRELFVIHGESLMRHCLYEAQVDFDGGFQLLHAIHAVEKFLSKLVERDCNFDIIFFRDLEHLCVPRGVSGENQISKYLLARRILIEHLSRSDLGFQILEFDSFESDECQSYLASHAIHFMLCDDGASGEQDEEVRLRHLIWQVMKSGKNVAVINSVAWKSSKIFMPLLSASNGALPEISIENSAPEEKKLSALSDAVLEEIDAPHLEDSDLSARERFTVAFCRVYFDQHSTTDADSEASLDRVEALLLQVATLKLSSLQDRTRETNGADVAGDDEEFLHLFCTASLALLDDGFDVDGDAEWDLFDLVDGRVFLDILGKIRDTSSGDFPAPIFEQGQLLFAEFIKENKSIEDRKPFTKLTAGESQKVTSSPAKDPAALPFSHPVLDKHLADVRVSKAREASNPAAAFVFEDLKYWNAYKPPNPPKKREEIPAWLIKVRAKKTQRRMRDVIAYAASLTSSVGKVLDRETIVVSKGGSKPKTSRTGANANASKGEQGKKGKDATQKGGRANALQAAQKLNEGKVQDKRNAVLRHWAEKCAEFESYENLVTRYLKALYFQYARSPGNHVSVRPEVWLYLCQVLGKIWAETRQQEDEGSLKGLYLVSMTWNWLRDISTSENCTPEVANAAKELIETLAMAQLNITVGEPRRKLPFAFQSRMMKDAPALIEDHRILQLEHGGPYMDRRFDSKPDARVPFEPDAWQRDVLDTIDANESLLVVAPTSAGKTFISFYAMKKVLEESDDGVLVYVAPTKALVNQIAAEVEARFSKSYNNQPGKSVWAINSGDYRINNPSRCQILVTVPHMLQAMLLAPNNASSPSSWSRRVKRIIFDEVHCIGQADDGVIWEQLLLLAPCPIIALSATVGNPNDLKDWLAISEARKGNEMKMIVHNVRYSDLRKFTYEPPKEFVFKELKQSPRLPVPGLDEGDTISPNFKFIHPVVALKDRNRAVLDDVTLEARDCLTLWNHMDKTFPEKLLKAKNDLTPLKALPAVIEKSHVIEWEKNLKTALQAAMEVPESPFDALQESLDAAAQAAIAGKDRAPTTTAGEDHVDQLFSLTCELHAQDALPAIAFNYDRSECERATESIFSKLQEAERAFKETDSAWQQKLKDFAQWQKVKANAKEAQDNKKAGGDQNMSKLETARAEASAEVSPWESFNPDAPLEQFSFAGTKAMQQAEFDDMTRWLNVDKVNPWLVDALRRGVGVHHAGMNRQYRQIVEMLFRNGYLRLVVATGTLALGINMPCKTVIFSGDSVYLSPQNYRQAAGRAGRRGFDLLGNIVFNGIPKNRVHEIMSSRLPALKGQFPVSTTLILRLFVLLSGTKNSKFAVDAVQALLSQTRLYLGGPEAEVSVKHHLRFSIEYLRRQGLLSADGKPTNFAGLVGHLYFTENAVFGFHSLLRGGYFHNLCKDFDTDRERVLREMMLVLSHLFNRVPLQRKHKLREIAKTSTSEIFLQQLPPTAEKLLVQHNRETLSIFKDYAHSYVNQHLVDKPDQTLPLTKISVGSGSDEGSAGEHSAAIRSPFARLSGFDDEFKSIKELCSSVRDGIFLEESAIPYMPIGPDDTAGELNAYIYDFYKHGSLEVLINDNGIDRGDVWFHLKDFSDTLKTIVTSLKAIISSGGDFDMDMNDDMSDADDGEDGEPDAAEMQVEPVKEVKETKAPTKKKAKVLDSWDDDSDESESESEDESADEAAAASSSFEKAGDLMKVLKAFTSLEEEFRGKFFDIGA